MKSITLGLFACLLAVGIPVLFAQAPVDHAADTEAALMRAKLASSQKILEGLMVQNLKLVHSGAEELEKICQATEWHAKEDQVYAHYRAELQRMAKRLANLAQNEDIDGATYTYMHSITTCMNCHEYCRDVLHVAHTLPNLQATPTPGAEQQSPSGIIRR
jgi:hypothetical protein